MLHWKLWICTLLWYMWQWMSSLFQCGFSSQALELNASAPLANMVYEILHTLCVNMNECTSIWSLTVIKKTFSFIATCITVWQQPLESLLSSCSFTVTETHITINDLMAVLDVSAKILLPSCILLIMYCSKKVRDQIAFKCTSFLQELGSARLAEFVLCKTRTSALSILWTHATFAADIWAGWLDIIDFRR